MWGFKHTPDESVIARLEALEDRQERLERRFIKLRGEFTQIMRGQYDNEEEEA